MTAKWQVLFYKNLNWAVNKDKNLPMGLEKIYLIQWENTF